MQELPAFPANLSPAAQDLLVCCLQTYVGPPSEQSTRVRLAQNKTSWRGGGALSGTRANARRSRRRFRTTLSRNALGGRSAPPPVRPSRTTTQSDGLLWLSGVILSTSHAKRREPPTPPPSRTVPNEDRPQRGPRPGGAILLNPAPPLRLVAGNKAHATAHPHSRMWHTRHWA